MHYFFLVSIHYTVSTGGVNFLHYFHQTVIYKKQSFFENEFFLSEYQYFSLVFGRYCGEIATIFSRTRILSRHKAHDPVHVLAPSIPIYLLTLLADITCAIHTLYQWSRSSSQVGSGGKMNPEIPCLVKRCSLFLRTSKSPHLSSVS